MLFTVFTNCVLVTRNHVSQQRILYTGLHKTPVCTVYRFMYHRCTVYIVQMCNICSSVYTHRLYSQEP